MGGANWPDGQLDATLCRPEHLKQFPINDNNVSFRHRCVLCPFSRCLLIILARRQVPGKQAKWQVEHGGRGAGGEGSPGMQASFYDDVTNGALSPDWHETVMEFNKSWECRNCLTRKRPTRTRIRTTLGPGCCSWIERYPCIQMDEGGVASCCPPSTPRNTIHKYTHTHTDATCALVVLIC